MISYIKNAVFGTFMVLLFNHCSTSESTLSAEQIVENCIKAIGGLDQIKKSETRIVSGIYFEPAYNLILNSKLTYKRAHSRLMEGVMKDGTFFKEGYDGNIAWEFYTGDSIPRVVKGEAQRTIQRGAEYDLPVVDYLEKERTIALLGTKILANRNHYIIEIREVDGFTTTYYVDTETYLPVAKKKVMQIHARGEEVPILVRYSEYNKVNGVLYPFTITERDMSNNGKILNVFTVNSIEINTPVEDAIFDHTQVLINMKHPSE